MKNVSGDLRRLIGIADTNGVPMAERSIDEYIAATEPSDRTGALQAGSADGADPSRRREPSGDQRDFAEVVNDYIEKLHEELRIGCLGLIMAGVPRLENGRFRAHISEMATIVQCNCGAEYRRTEEKFLVPHTGDAVCAVCGAALKIVAGGRPTSPHTSLLNARRR